MLPHSLAILTRIPMARLRLRRRRWRRRLLMHNTKGMDLHMTTVGSPPLIQNKLWVESVPLQMMTLTTRPLIPLSHRILVLDHELTSHVPIVAAMGMIIPIRPTSRPFPRPLRR